METAKRRSSLDDPGVASALRRLTQTPRLGLRRPGTIMSSSSSSVSSFSSHEHDKQTACVVRDTSHDDCALNRFIVWAAVKRNTSPDLNPAEHRQCPLYRCQKRFPNHELMLQHLYTCDELSSGEYWCTDCRRIESFTDAKCKRCIGHPSKRRRIMFMARNFFSSLGHRSKTGSEPDIDLDTDEAVSNYDDSLDVFDLPQPEQAELQSNEIHEIDSHEVPLPTIMEDAEEEYLSLPIQLPRSVSPLSSITPSYVNSNAAELEAAANWQVCFQPQPQTVAPANLSLSNAEHDIASPVRPNLQVQTTDLAAYREQAKRRSKLLAPSSSVRSTASTNSTNSTASTSSCMISPISTWSGSWGRAAGFDSHLTTPADDFAPNNPFGPLGRYCDNLQMAELLQDCSYQTNTVDLSNGFSGHEFSSELPADISMLDGVVPPVQEGHLLQPVPQASLSSEPTMSNPPWRSGLLSNGSLDCQSQTTVRDYEVTPSSSGNAQSLVQTAWTALKLHVTESHERLATIRENYLVDQLRSMSPEMVASLGLKALGKLLDGRVIEAPLDLLCFVHLVYSFSLVIHEQDALSRGKNMFTQAMSYASWLTQDERRAYLIIVNHLWRPVDMSKDEVNTLARKTSSAARARSGPNGKQPHLSAHDISQDPLAFVSQFFLDTLELLALRETERSKIQASELCMQHMKDFNYAQNGQMIATATFMHDILMQEYCSVSKFATLVGDLRHRVSSSHIPTTRRLELELINVGKESLPPDTFFDRYVPIVRSQIDGLHSLDRPGSNPRLAYHHLCVKLIESIIPNSTTANDKSSEAGASIHLDDFINDMSSNLDEFDFSTISDLGSIPPGNYAVAESPESPVISNSVTPHTDESIRGPSTAATSPPSQGTTPAIGPSAKPEPYSCCEICGYRPEGDPRWFQGSMAKHKKLQHSTAPPKIYQCPFPGCTSKYTNRPDNLRQHQIKKGHFVDGEEDLQRRPSKRKKTED